MNRILFQVDVTVTQPVQVTVPAAVFVYSEKF